jgi:hypothetical protein
MGEAASMSTATIDSTNGAGPHHIAEVPQEIIDRLNVRIAGRDEDMAIDELAARAGRPRPEGALIVAAVDGRLLAAASLSNGEALSEPTPSGKAAAAVARYKASRLRHPRR